MGDARIAPEETTRAFEPPGEGREVGGGESGESGVFDPAGAFAFFRERGELRGPATAAKPLGDRDESFGNPGAAGIAGGGMNHDPGRIGIGGIGFRLESGL